jgi:hypothetical protein
MNGSNDNEKLIDELANLLNETAEAHHKAFAATEYDKGIPSLFTRVTQKTSSLWLLWWLLTSYPFFSFTFFFNVFSRSMIN